jgi:Ca2+-binding EF-hand superfamily protein
LTHVARVFEHRYFSKMTCAQLIEEEQAKRAAAKKESSYYREMFAAADADNSGELSHVELKDLCQSLGRELVCSRCRSG